MIFIEITLNESGLFKSFHLKGHANYDEYGKDIVCAGASAVIVGALNAIDDIKLFSTEVKEGKIDIVAHGLLSKHDEIVIEVMITQLETIEHDYGKYVRITKKTEV